MKNVLNGFNCTLGNGQIKVNEREDIAIETLPNETKGKN